MNRDDVITKIVLPVVIVAVSSSVTLYLANRHTTGELALETVRIHPGAPPATDFGAWEMVALSAEQNRRQRQAPRDDSETSGESDWKLNDNCTRGTAPRAELEIPRWLWRYGTARGGPRKVWPENRLGIAAYYAEWRYHDQLPAGWQHWAKQHAPLSWNPDPNNPLEAQCTTLNLALGETGRIVKAPVFQIVLRNPGKAPVTLQEFVATPIESFGGEAGGGGAPIVPVGDRTDIRIRVGAPSTAPLAAPINLDPSMTTMLEIRPGVENASGGDGSGVLLFRLALRYFDGEKPAELFVGNFLLADDIEQLAVY